MRGEEESWKKEGFGFGVLKDVEITHEEIEKIRPEDTISFLFIMNR